MLDNAKIKHSTLFIETTGQQVPISNNDKTTTRQVANTLDINKTIQTYANNLGESIISILRKDHVKPSSKRSHVKRTNGEVLTSIECQSRIDEEIKQKELKRKEKADKKELIKSKKLLAIAKKEEAQKRKTIAKENKLNIKNTNT